MTQVKICGITNAEDALLAAKCGADALGFIFYPQSPRYIAPEEARQIIDKLPASVVSVGVFVNETVAEVKLVSALCSLDFMQFHGDESVDYCHNFPSPMIIKAVELREEKDLQKAIGYNAAAILVDSREAGLYGGTGRKANWDLALRVQREKPLILSGGLNEENIHDAMKMVTPDALDINSGVEIEPGKKDHRKLARIFDMVRQVQTLQKETPKIFIKRKK
jgi:phosphoribosylanthranilate isomerase